MINKIMLMAFPFLHYVRRREVFWMLPHIQSPALATRIVRLLSTGFDFFRLNAHRVVVGFDFASGAICVHLGKFSAK